MNPFYVKISKFLAYVLRHHPEKFGIAIDNEGFADLGFILEILKERFKGKKISKEIIQDIIRNSDKLRYEIVEDKIRAFYGHSLEVKIEMKEANPVPPNLYHGTNKSAYEKIKHEGLKKKGRQYVHLSDNIKTATMVGKRSTTKPLILEIDTESAKAEGIKFYKSGDMFLAEFIPPKYISLRI